MKLVVASDVHISASTLEYPWAGYDQIGGCSKKLLPALLDTPFDELLITGDIVNLGHADEFAMANEIFRPFKGRLRCVPGNHDVATCSIETFVSSVVGATRADIVDDGVVVRILLNSAVENLPLTQWYGRIDEPSLETLMQGLSIARGRPVLIFIHHPPAGTIRLADGPMMTLVNSSSLLDPVLAYPGPVVLFCGHNHRPDVVRHRNVTIVGCPSVAFWPHAVLCVELVGSLLTIRTRRLLFDPAQSPHAKSRVDSKFRADCEPTVEAISIRL